MNLKDPGGIGTQTYDTILLFVGTKLKTIEYFLVS